MKCFEVRQEQEDLWSVSNNGAAMYRYTSEAEAHWAAVMLATKGGGSGAQATVALVSRDLSNNPHVVSPEALLGVLLESGTRFAPEP